MNKENFEITSYLKIDEEFDTIVSLHKAISLNTNLYGRLIYFDRNFPNYIRGIIETSHNDFFYVARYEGRVKGFLHLKVFNDFLFLNNISIADGFQGGGLGRTLLATGIGRSVSPKIKQFSLDVFLSNTRAHAWYKSMGLQCVSQNVWRKCETNKFNGKSDQQERKDQNGFNGIFIGDEKIATLINNHTIILHKPELINSIDLNGRTLITNQKCSTQNSYNDCATLEVAERMSVKIQIIIDKLKKCLK